MAARFEATTLQETGDPMSTQLRRSKRQHRVVTTVTFVVAYVFTSNTPVFAQSADEVLCSGHDFAACINMGYTAHGFQAVYQSSYWRAYPGHNCTNYASYMMTQLGAATPSGLMDNGMDWKRNAVDVYGIATADDTPAVGSIAQWDAKAGYAGEVGHVAYVERVSDSFIVISEDNYDIGPFRWRKIYRGSYDWPSNFLHFKGVSEAAATAVKPPARYHRNFNKGGGDDVLMYGTGSARDVVLHGNDDRNVKFLANDVTINGAYDRIVKTDFNGDDYADLLFYGRGSEPDAIWFGSDTRGVFDKSKDVSVNGDYDRVLAGDFNGDGKSDVLFYGSGSKPDAIWFGSSTKGVFDKTHDIEVNGSGYTAAVGDFNGDRRFDIVWDRPLSSDDSIWYGTDTSAKFDMRPLSIAGSYEPVVADYNGNGKDDILWYGRGDARDTMWFGSGDKSTKFAVGFDVTVNGSEYQPLPGDFDDDGKGDILWYLPGSGDGSLWYGTDEKGNFVMKSTSIDGYYRGV